MRFERWCQLQCLPPSKPPRAARPSPHRTGPRFNPVDHGGDVLGIVRQIVGAFLELFGFNPAVEKDGSFLYPDLWVGKPSVASRTLWSRLKISPPRATGFTFTFEGAGENSCLAGTAGFWDSPALPTGSCAMPVEARTRCTAPSNTARRTSSKQHIAGTNVQRSVYARHRRAPRPARRRSKGWSYRPFNSSFGQPFFRPQPTISPYEGIAPFIQCPWAGNPRSIGRLLRPDGHDDRKDDGENSLHQLDPHGQCFSGFSDLPDVGVKKLHRISKTVVQGERPYIGFNLFDDDDQRLFESQTVFPICLITLSSWPVRMCPSLFQVPVVVAVRGEDHH